MFYFCEFTQNRTSSNERFKFRMRKYFLPDFMFDSIYEITPDFLHEKKIEALVLDIDNTLVTYGISEPTAEVKSWVDFMKKNGIKIAIASNNKKERVELFNREMQVLASYSSKKPSRRSVFAACRHFNVMPEKTAVIGDQIFTDVLCAKRAGAVGILVTPLKYKENLFFRFKRFFERPFISYYKKKNNIK